MSGKTGRSSRVQRIEASELLRIAPNADPPPAGSLAGSLWTHSLPIAREALATEYITKIGEGNLNPNHYGHYTIQDVAYCSGAIADYGRLVAKAKELKLPELAAFAQVRRDSYEKYAREMGSAWHISNPGGVSPGPAAAQYIRLEAMIAAERHPIYGIVVMIPCYMLWAWLANQLRATSRPGNLYEFWITENLSWDSGYRMGNFLNAWAAANPAVIDPSAAREVYEAAMWGEADFFRSAGGEALHTIPLEQSAAGKRRPRSPSP